MLRKKVLIPIVSIATALVLTLTLVMVLVLPNESRISLAANGAEQTVEQKDDYTVIDELPSDFSFKVELGSGQSIDEALTVTDSEGNLVDVVAKKMANNIYDIKAPKGGYKSGYTYTAKVNKGTKFVSWQESVVHYTIQADEGIDVALYDNIVQVAADKVVARGENTLSIVRPNGVIVGKGTIIVTAGDEQGLTPEEMYESAYKVESVVLVGNTLVMNTSKPEIEEIYDRLDVNISKDATEDDITFNEERATEGILNSPMVMAMADAGMVKPEVGFNFKYNKEAGTFNLDISLTFSGIFKNSNVNDTLTIKVANVIDLELVHSINKDLSKFNVGVNVETDTTTSVTLNVGASGSTIKNVQDVLTAVEERTGDNSMATMRKIFTWNIPVCTGLNISYDMDFAFRYGFQGTIDASVDTELDYSAGIMKADGEVIGYVETHKNEITGASLKARAVLNLKAGVINYLNINIMNVVGAGVEFEVGLYSDIYAAIQLNYKNGNVDGTDGIGAGVAAYLDAGVYWDVNLKAHLGINNVLDISQGFDIVDGKHQLFELGNREMMVNLLEVGESELNGEEDSVVMLSAKESRMPRYKVRMYDIVADSYKDIEVEYTDINFIQAPNSNINIDAKTGIITLKEGVTAVDEYVLVEMLDVKEGSASYVLDATHIVLKSGNPILDANYFYADKTNLEEVVFDINLGFNAGNKNVFERLEGNGIVYGDFTTIPTGAMDENKVRVTVAKDYLLSMPSARMYFDVVTIVNGEEFRLPITIDIANELNARSIGKGTVEEPYMLYAREQIVDMINESQNGETFSGVYFELGHDIDMRAYDIDHYVDATTMNIKAFAGVLDGNGFAIRNFIINESEGQATGFIKENYGTVKNITLGGTIDTTRKNVDLYSGLVAGINHEEAVIENVTTEGTVRNLISGSDKVNIYLAGVAGINYGKIADCDANVRFDAIADMDLVWYHYNIAGIAGMNYGSIENSAHINVNSKLNLDVQKGSTLIIKNSLKVADINF